jgi:hypothetical protein
MSRRNSALTADERLEALRNILDYLQAKTPRREEFDSLADYRHERDYFDAVFVKADDLTLDAGMEVRGERRQTGLTIQEIWSAPSN